jgi:hypothetical protein
MSAAVVVAPVPLKCHECNGVADTMHVCTGCDTVAYCSDTCQKTRWKSDHREACAIIKQQQKVASVVDDDPSLVKVYDGVLTRAAAQLNSIVVLSTRVDDAVDVVNRVVEELMILQANMQNTSRLQRVKRVAALGNATATEAQVAQQYPTVPPHMRALMLAVMKARKWDIASTYVVDVARTKRSWVPSSVDTLTDTWTALSTNTAAVSAGALHRVLQDLVRRIDAVPSRLYRYTFDLPENEYQDTLSGRCVNMSTAAAEVLTFSRPVRPDREHGPVIWSLSRAPVPLTQAPSARTTAVVTQPALLPPPPEYLTEVETSSTNSGSTPTVNIAVKNTRRGSDALESALQDASPAVLSLITTAIRRGNHRGNNTLLIDTRKARWSDLPFGRDGVFAPGVALHTPTELIDYLTPLFRDVSYKKPITYTIAGKSSNGVRFHIARLKQGGMRTRETAAIVRPRVVQNTDGVLVIWELLYDPDYNAAEAASSTTVAARTLLEDGNSDGQLRSTTKPSVRAAVVTKKQ